MDRLVTLFLAGGVVAAGAARWRLSLKAVLFLTVFEGAIRKWLLPQVNEYVYFLKDVILLGVYIGAIFDPFRKPARIDPLLIIILVAACAVVALQSFNPNQGTLFAGLFGLKVYLWYVPLIWLVGDAFPDETSFRRFVWPLMEIVERMTAS